MGLLISSIATPFLLLGYVFLFGLVWDAIYQYLITFRWDRDWPTVFQALAGVFEGALLWLLLRFVNLPGIPARSVPFGVFIGMYASIWLLTSIIAQGPLRAVLVRWRYQGGEWR